MAAHSTEAPPRAILAYVEQMLLELARMTEQTGRTDLARRIEGVAAETAFEVTGMAFTPMRQDRPQTEPRARQG